MTLKLIGHEEKLSFFMELINENKFPKVLLLTGDKGIGKFTFIFHCILLIVVQFYLNVVDNSQL